MSRKNQQTADQIKAALDKNDIDKGMQVLRDALQDPATRDGFTKHMQDGNR